TEIRLRHLINISVNSTVQIFRGDTGAQVGANFTVVSYDSATGRIKLNPAVGQELVAARGDFVQIHQRSATPGPAANTTLIFRAKSRGDWGNVLSVRVRPMVGATFRILPDSTVGGALVRTTLSAQANAGDATLNVASVTGLNNGDHVLIGGREYVLSNV